MALVNRLLRLISLYHGSLDVVNDTHQDEFTKFTVCSGRMKREVLLQALEARWENDQYYPFRFGETN
jgi:hypothetical protein